jgi:hypothetical protein
MPFANDASAADWAMLDLMGYLPGGHQSGRYVRAMDH